MSHTTHVTIERIRPLVFAAFADGKNISSSAIREVLGTGSLSTIEKILADVRRELASSALPGLSFSEDPEALAVANDLFAALMRFCSARAQTQAEAILAEERAKAQQLANEAAHEKATAKGQIDVLSKRVADLEAQLQSAQQETVRITAELASCSESHARDQADLSELKQHHTDLKLERDTLSRQLQQANITAATTQERLDREKEDRARAEAEIEKLRKESDTWRDLSDGFRSKLLGAEGQIKTLNELVEALRAGQQT